MAGLGCSVVGVSRMQPMGVSEVVRSECSWPEVATLHSS